MGKKILIVEDDEKNAKLFIDLLSSLGYECFSASNGKSGIEYCRKLFPDLVLMDIQLPVLDGVTAMKRIKQFSPNLLVVALTAFALPDDEDKFLKEGFDAYISKPIDINNFGNIIAEMV